MPDPRPMSTHRNGAHDDPPASSESASTGRTRLRRMIQQHLESENNGEASVAQGTPPQNTSRRGIRRRRTSYSPMEADADANPPEEESSTRQRANKRRRIDRSSPRQASRLPIKYGYYGQVEPGRLKMELVSCDGGEHKDPRSPENLGPRNMLRHDKSVYCSESPRVNIILRHLDDTPFCLEKLHIVAPENGFTSPVREGIVYIGMTLADLNEYINTTEAEPRAPSPRRRNFIRGPLSQGPRGLPETARTLPSQMARGRNLRASPERLTLADALRDPEIDAAVTERNYARDADGAHDLADDLDPEEDLYAQDFGHSYNDLHCVDPPYSRSPSLEPGGNSSANESRSRSRNRPFTLLSDEEPGPEDTSPPGWTEYRLQRWRNMRRRLEIENWDREERWGGLNRMPPEAGGESAAEGRERGTWNLSRLDQLMARSRVQDDEEDSPPPLESASPPRRSPWYHRLGRESESRAPDTPNNDATTEFSNVTKASFHIKKSKHKVAIKFSPPVSGRFVLLKFWSAPGEGRTGASRGLGNVDVQTVILKGFGGARFFPAIEMR